MSSKYRAQAEKLTARRYFKITSLDKNTEGEPIYFARVIELEGCFGQGITIESALEDLHEAMVDYIESLLEGGFPVPAPAELIRTTSASAGTTLTRYQ